MRILMTTGIFEPEAGGPATLTPKIAARLSESGWGVTVVTYSDMPSFDSDSKYPFHLVRVVRRGNRLVNYLAFFMASLKYMSGADIVYSLDWLAAGLPVTFASILRCTPVVIRVGGDYNWERYLETDQQPIPLKDFYEKGLYRQRPIMFEFIRLVLRRANHVIFNTDIQRDLYHKYLGLLPAHTSVIYNPVPKAIAGVVRNDTTHEIVFAARFVAMKNPLTLIRAFAQAKLPASYRLVLIGNGPAEVNMRNLISEMHLEDKILMLPGMRQAELYERIRNCRALVLPSWTDISPNQVFEAMQMKIPMLVTKENYLSIKEQLPETIDPTSIDDIARKLEMLADERRYLEFTARWNQLSFEYGWNTEMAEHQKVFTKALKK